MLNFLTCLKFGHKVLFRFANIHDERREGTGLKTARQPVPTGANSSPQGEHEVMMTNGMDSSPL
jgi:hypothetical protein